jgi:hypothetical protein
LLVTREDIRVPKGVLSTDLKHLITFIDITSLISYISVRPYYHIYFIHGPETAYLDLDFRGSRQPLKENDRRIYSFHILSNLPGNV